MVLFNDLLMNYCFKWIVVSCITARLALNDPVGAIAERACTVRS